MKQIKYDGILGLPKLAAQFFFACVICGLLVGWVVAYPVVRMSGGSHEEGEALANFNIAAGVCAPVCAIPVYGNYLHCRLLLKLDVVNETLKMGTLPRSRADRLLHREGSSKSSGQVPVASLPFRFKISAVIWGFLGVAFGFCFWAQLIDLFRTQPSGPFSERMFLLVVAAGIIGAGISAWCFFGK